MSGLWVVVFRVEVSAFGFWAQGSEFRLNLGLGLEVRV